jgi:hypothetical protein
LPFWRPYSFLKSSFTHSEVNEILPSHPQRDRVCPSHIVRIIELGIIVFPKTDRADVKSAWRFVIQCLMSTAWASVLHNSSSIASLTRRLPILTFDVVSGEQNLALQEVGLAAPSRPNIADYIEDQT